MDILFIYFTALVLVLLHGFTCMCPLFLPYKAYDSCGYCSIMTYNEGSLGLCLVTRLASLVVGGTLVLLGVPMSFYQYSG